MRNAVSSHTIQTYIGCCSAPSRGHAAEAHTLAVMSNSSFLLLPTDENSHSAYSWPMDIMLIDGLTSLAVIPSPCVWVSGEAGGRGCSDAGPAGGPNGGWGGSSAMLGGWSPGERLRALLLCCDRRSGNTGPPTSDVLADLEPVHTHTHTEKSTHVHLFIAECRQELAPMVCRRAGRQHPTRHESLV